MQKLEVFQSLWAMEKRHPREPERTAEENFTLVAEAGFAGMCLDPALEEIPDCLALQPLFEKYKLKCMVNAFPRRVREIRPLLEMAKQMDAVLFNVIGGVMPLTAAGAVPVIYRWLEEADRVGLPFTLETHRDGMLNDLFYTLQVIDDIPELRLCADLSHFVLDREMRAPLTERDRGFMRRILERSDCLQGRIASREQIQIQIGFPQHQQWVQIFRGWWRDGMSMWRQRSPADVTLVFLSELGPPPYAMTDAQGLELSDRWQEALTLKRWAEEIWAGLGAPSE